MPSYYESLHQYFFFFILSNSIVTIRYGSLKICPDLISFLLFHAITLFHQGDFEGHYRHHNLAFGECCSACAIARPLEPEEEFLGIDGYTRMYLDQAEQVREVRKKLETLKWIAHGQIQAFKEDLRPHEIYQEMEEMQKNKIHIQDRYLSTRENFENTRFYLRENPINKVLQLLLEKRKQGKCVSIFSYGMLFVYFN